MVWHITPSPRPCLALFALLAGAIAVFSIPDFGGSIWSIALVSCIVGAVRGRRGERVGERAGARGRERAIEREREREGEREREEMPGRAGPKITRF